MKWNLISKLIKAKYVKFKSDKNTFHSDFINTSLEELQHRLIVTPNDMTNENVVVIYEKLYFQTLMKEVELKGYYGNI